MNKSVAILTQWVGKATVVFALVLLIWNVSDIIGDNDGQFGAGGFGPNRYLQAVTSSASLAVTGMLAVGIGMMLDRFDDLPFGHGRSVDERFDDGRFDDA